MMRKKYSPEELEDLQLQLELQVEELNRAQLDIEEARRKYFELFDLAPFAYFTLNEQGMILEANMAAMKLLGEKVRGRLYLHRFGNYIRAEFQDVWSEFREEVFSTGSRVQCEVSVVRKDGISLLAQIDAMPGQVSEGSPKKLWMVVSDITPWKRAEDVLKRDKEALDCMVSERTRQLLVSQDKLEKAERLSDIGTLAATIAHELRNPLAAIKMAAYNISRKRSFQPVDSHLETINRKIAGKRPDYHQPAFLFEAETTRVGESGYLSADR